MVQEWIKSRGIGLPYTWDSGQSTSTLILSIFLYKTLTSREERFAGFKTRKRLRRFSQSKSPQTTQEQEWLEKITRKILQGAQHFIHIYQALIVTSPHKALSTIMMLQSIFPFLWSIRKCKEVQFLAWGRRETERERREREREFDSWLGSLATFSISSTAQSLPISFSPFPSLSLSLQPHAKKNLSFQSLHSEKKKVSDARIMTGTTA